MSTTLTRRSLRAAGLLVALAVPVVAASALPAFASGEVANAVLTSPATDASSTTFTWSYTFGGGEHALSNIAVGFCSAEILADVVDVLPKGSPQPDGVTGGHDGFGPGVKFDVTDDSGTLTLVFGHSHPVVEDALSVQSHSGDGTTGDAVTHADGPGPCAETIIDDNNNDDNNNNNNNNNNNDNNNNNNSQDDNGNGNANGNQNDNANKNNVDPAVLGATVTSDPAPTGGTSVLGETVVAPVTVTTAAPADVAGTTLPRTGMVHLDLLVRLAVGLLGAGLLLLSVARRRTSSTSSAG